ncbi:MAG: hypothetical protein WBA13_07915 [Microcoleaceae cyanobacterium]
MTDNSSSNQSPQADFNPQKILETFTAQTSEEIQNALLIANQMADATMTQAQQWFDEAMHGTGSVLASIAENPIIKSGTKLFGANWLLAILGEVDTQAAQNNVLKLKQKYPQETAEQLAHRVMIQKSIEAAGVGFATNIIPPIAAALFAIDLAATTKIQAEMIYQIAAVYQLDLTLPARRGEALAIFGLSFGGSSVLKAGLGIIEIIPGVGAVVGASSNAILLYCLGYAARQFYEAKIQPDIDTGISALSIDNPQEEIKKALEQEQVMDQILAHTILATYPDKSWTDIILELQKARLNPQSIEKISTHLKDPQPLEALLDKLHPDFAPALLVQCYRIAESGENTTPQEHQIINAIVTRFNLDLDEIKMNLNQSDMKIS